MDSTEFLKMMVAGYSDAADIEKVVQNFIVLDDNAKTNAESIENLKKRVEKLEKTQPDIKINSFTVTPKTVEKGDVVSIDCAWDLSTESVKTVLNGITLTGNSYTDTGVASNKTYNLSVEDERGKKATANASVSFVNRIYYGASAAEILTADAVKNMTSVVSGAKNRTTILKPSNQYMYYCYPKSLGTSTFKIGIMTGGFVDPVEINVPNTKGFTEAYFVYRSENKVSGTFELTVE